MLTPKALSERLKNVVLNLISTQKTAYIKNRFIGEDGRLISDIANICDHNNIKYALLNNHESCVMCYVSAYVFVLCLKILFILIKSDPNIKGI